MVRTKAESSSDELDLLHLLYVELEPAVTHVAMSLGGDEFIHAPMRGGFVEERKIGADRVPVSIRRYLMGSK